MAMSWMLDSMITVNRACEFSSTTGMSTAFGAGRFEASTVGSSSPR